MVDQAKAVSLNYKTASVGKEEDNVGLREYVPFFEKCYKQVYQCTRQLCGQQWDDLAGESRQWGGGASSLLPTLRCLAPWDRTEAPN